MSGNRHPQSHSGDRIVSGTHPAGAAPDAHGGPFLPDSTTSLCPLCLKLIDSRIEAHGGQVIMRKICPDHGKFEVLIFSDADLYLKAQRFNRPGASPLHHEKKVERGCPYDCGLCPDHQQHTCLGILEVTRRCNLECPTCFADSRPAEVRVDGQGSQARHDFLPLDTVKFMLDKFVEAEGKPEVVQISGGEPSLHPQIIQIIREARKRHIRSVMLNTNGIRLARDRRFQEALGEVKPHLYLQFDGFKEETYERLRGRRDLLKEKMRALEAAESLGLTVVLVVTVQRGVNEDELGEIVSFARKTPPVRGISFQPTTYVRRHPEFNPMTRMTNADVIFEIERQTNRLLVRDDFVPVPCCSPGCQYVTYIYSDGETFVPFPRVVEVEEYLDCLKNRSVPDLKKMTREALERLWSATSVAGSSEMGERLTLACCGIELPDSLDLSFLEKKTLMINIIHFLDPWSFDLRRARKCCIGEIVPDGRIVPLCTYNLLYRK